MKESKLIVLRYFWLILSIVLFNLYIVILSHKIVIFVLIRIIITVCIMHLFSIFNIKHFHIIMIFQIFILYINHQFRYFLIFKIFIFIFFWLLIKEWSCINLNFLFVHNILNLNIIQAFIFVKFVSIVCI
jgi:hypothetical protein